MTTSTRLAPANGVSLTWIDARMADEQRAGWPGDDYRTGRWSVFETVCCNDFMVQHESGSGGSMGGDETDYPARVVAAAIERWSAPCVGLDATPAFFEALKQDALAAELKAEEARVEAIRSRALANSMQARAKIAQADAAQRGWSKPFAPSTKEGEAGRGN